MPYEPPPYLASLTLAEIAALVADRKLPPVEGWAPQVIGESHMVIAADGTWFHEGGVIRREAMVRAFAGLLTRDAIIHALRQSGPATPVADAMADIPRVPRRLPLPDAIRLLAGSPAVAVESADGRFAGLLTAANIADLIALTG